MLIRLSINARYKAASRVTGVQRFSECAITALENLEEVVIHYHVPSPFFSSGFKGHLWEQFILPFLARKSDVLFSPGNSGPIFFVNKHLICIHDVIAFSHPNLFRLGYRLASKLLLKSYRYKRVRIITVSINAQREIRRLVQEKMAVSTVGMGLTKHEGGVVSKKWKFEQYFLFVGGNIERKNLVFLLEFWERIHVEIGYSLVVTVREKGKTQLQSNFKQVTGVLYVNNPNDDELATLYRDSRALLWPSIAEGFGIPLLESMSHGKPFISSPVGAAEELRVGESKIIPLNSEKWLTAIIELVRFPQLSPEEQIRVSSNYSWSKVADRIKQEIFSSWS